MESANYVGLVAVVAASGSVALVALQAHRRLTSNFMKRIELEFGGKVENEGRKRGGKTKKVRFADDVMEPSSNNKEYRKQHVLARVGKMNGLR